MVKEIISGFGNNMAKKKSNTTKALDELNSFLIKSCIYYGIFLGIAKLYLFILTLII